MNREYRLVNAISEYYNQKGLADHYYMMASDPSLDDTDELLSLSDKHHNLARASYDYVLMTFKEEISEASENIKQHLASEGAH